MRRQAKPAKPKAKARRAAGRTTKHARTPPDDGDPGQRLAEALAQQAATIEILRVIRRSPTDIEPVFDAIARSAARLCEAQFCFVYRFVEGHLHFVAQHGLAPEGIAALRRAWPQVPTRGSAAGRSVLSAAVEHIPDVHADPDYELGRVATIAAFRSTVAVPMIRDGRPVGAITVSRSASGPFPDRQIALLETFADQAVIAIENVRLFQELETRNRDLTETLEQQTATGEILRVISSSPTDVQPVFDTIVQNVVRLCDGLFSALFRFDGEQIDQVAQHNFTPEALAEVRRIYPTRPSRGLGSARAILERAVVHIPDVEQDPDYEHRELIRAVGFRSGLYVPMMREGDPIGVIMVARAEPGSFSPGQIELLKTFAEQAVIALPLGRDERTSSRRSGVATRSSIRRPSASAAGYPNSRSAPGFQPVTWPPRSMVTIATGLVSTSASEYCFWRWISLIREDRLLGGLVILRRERGNFSSDIVATPEEPGVVDGFRRAAHSLKSNGETLGATTLAALARELEGMARTGRLHGVEHRLPALVAEYEAATRALGALRHGLSA